MKQAVLLVDDNPFVLQLLAGELRKMALEPVCASDGREAIARLAVQDFPLVITDLEMPVMNGVQLIGKLRQSQPTAKVIVLCDSDTGFVDALEPYGIEAVLSKPFSMQEFETSVRTLLDLGPQPDGRGRTSRLANDPPKSDRLA
jgi:CheY-like chemotaxis protein